MPFVRFSRDKRGYEHLYLVDTGRDRGRSRVLYWFRTPPGVRVGRSPFDSETQRALERQNPDVQFDWPQIVAAKIPPPVAVESWREKRRVERAIKRARAEDLAPDSSMDGTGEEPPEQAVEVAAAEAWGLEPPDGAAEGFEERANVDDGPAETAAPCEIEDASTAAVSPDSGAAEAVNGAALDSRRRRRRRGRRRPRPEAAPVPDGANGELDPSSQDSQSANEE